MRDCARLRETARDTCETRARLCETVRDCARHVRDTCETVRDWCETVRDCARLSESAAKVLDYIVILVVRPRAMPRAPTCTCAPWQGQLGALSKSPFPAAPSAPAANSATQRCFFVPTASGGASGFLVARVSTPPTSSASPSGYAAC